jgi:hypothetical protein
LWLVVAAAALGLLAWRLGLDRSDKLASIGSFVLALIALAAAARMYLRPGENEPPARPAPGSKYTMTVHGDPKTINTGDGQTVTINEYGEGPPAADSSARKRKKR